MEMDWGREECRQTPWLCLGKGENIEKGPRKEGFKGQEKQFGL